MMALFKKLFGNGDKPKRDFSDFFTKTSAPEKADLLQRVVREANEDQKRLMDEAKEVLSKKTART